MKKEPVQPPSGFLESRFTLKQFNTTEINFHNVFPFSYQNFRKFKLHEGVKKIIAGRILKLTEDVSFRSMANPNGV